MFGLRVRVLLRISEERMCFVTVFYSLYMTLYRTALPYLASAWYVSSFVVNPQRACARGLHSSHFVCQSVCLSVCLCDFGEGLGECAVLRVKKTYTSTI